MTTNKRLRQQIISEAKKRRLVFTTILLLCLVYFGISLIFGETGLIKYMELAKKRDKLRQEVVDIEKDNMRMTAHLKSLKENKFLLEKHAREEYGLARPDEYVYVFRNDKSE